MVAGENAKATRHVRMHQHRLGEGVVAHVVLKLHRLPVAEVVAEVVAVGAAATAVVVVVVAAVVVVVVVAVVVVAVVAVVVAVVVVVNKIRVFFLVKV